MNDQNDLDVGMFIQELLVGPPCVTETLGQDVSQELALPGHLTDVVYHTYSHHPQFVQERYGAGGSC